MHSHLGQTEYNIYYNNVVYPYSRDVMVEVKCEYGADYGRFWRFNGICDKDEFAFTLRATKDNGETIEKNIIMELVSPKTKGNLLCIGDSMTRAGVYEKRILDLLPGVRGVGLRRFDGKNYCEGRGGWSINNYFKRIQVGSKASPFMFPCDDTTFWEDVLGEKGGEYTCIGFGDAAKWLKDNESKKSYAQGLSFEGYIHRFGGFNNISETNVVSILLGTNDCLTTKSIEIDSITSEWLALLDKFIVSVNDYKAIPILLCLPTFSGRWDRDDYAAAKREYDYNIATYGSKLINKFENDKRVLIVPTGAMCDPKFGFASEGISPNKYTEHSEVHIGEWIHPNKNGYRQMGDAMSGAVAKAFMQNND